MKSKLNWKDAAAFRRSSKKVDVGKQWRTYGDSELKTGPMYFSKFFLTSIPLGSWIDRVFGILNGRNQNLPIKISAYSIVSNNGICKGL